MANTRTVVALIVGACAVVSAACSSTEEGEPQTTRVTSAPKSESSTATTGEQPTASLSNIDPCSLLSADELSKYGTFPAGAPNNVGTARGCKFEKDTDSPTTDPNRVISVNLRDQQGIDDVQDLGQGIDRGEVEGRSYARVPGPGVCTIVIGVSQTSRVDVNTIATEGTEKSCEIADEVAAVVEPKLPQG
ncbi:DUF3558 domain-containing protein [Prauserella aidingensis]|uniref:DUF3558 domain-containing protein n=1 Tax=Prauserella aidingensis TaxID=387890 RepID=UPI0020A56EF9|nr:DUF3558 domain-containing protein [Prauserella aidingensis]